MVLRSWIKGEGWCFGGCLSGVPPDLDTLKLISNLFMLIHAEYKVGFVTVHLGLEVFGRFSGGATQVGLDPGVGFAAPEALPTVFGEGDLNVGVVKIHQFRCICCDIHVKLMRKELTSHCPQEHEACNH